MRRAHSTVYTLAALNMVISGVAIYVNSLGVKMFSDSTLCTAPWSASRFLCLLCPLFPRPATSTISARVK
jgi:hypothetical protein